MMPMVQEARVEDVNYMVQLYRSLQLKLKPHIILQQRTYMLQDSRIVGVNVVKN